MFENAKVQYLLLWLFGFVLPSIIILRIMIHYKVKTEFFYIAVFLIFIIASIFRCTGFYPGKYEPLWVDTATAFISVILAFVIRKASYSSRYILYHIPFLFIIAIPHCIYILTSEDIGHPWYIGSC